MSFHDQLIITIIDKGLLALLIVIAMLLVNLVLERSKSVFSRNNEIQKLRIEAMNEVWSAIYTWITESNLLIANDRVSGNPDVYIATENVRKLSEQLVAKIEKNRFLCGNLFSNDCLLYCNSFLHYYMRFREANSWGDGEEYMNLKKRGENIVSSRSKYIEDTAWSEHLG